MRGSDMFLIVVATIALALTLAISVAGWHGENSRSEKAEYARACAEGLIGAKVVVFGKEGVVTSVSRNESGWYCWVEFGFESGKSYSALFIKKLVTQGQKAEDNI